MREFFRWLETATDEQLEKAHGDLTELISRLVDQDVKRDAKFRLRLLEEEILARSIARQAGDRRAGH